MKPEERDAVKAEENAIINAAYAVDGCTRVSEMKNGGWHALTMFDGDAALFEFVRVFEFVRALTAQSPAGVPPEPDDYNSTIDWQGETPSAGVPPEPTLVERQTTLGPEINAILAERRSELYEGVPTTEPVAPIARTPATVIAGLSEQYAARQAAALRGDETAIKAADFWLAKVSSGHWHEILADLRSLHAAAPQAPVAPVAQEPVGFMYADDLAELRERGAAAIYEQRQRFEMGHEQTPTPLYDSPVEAGWVAMKDRKPKANQVVCVYWPPNLKDGSHVVDVVEWGVHDCARLLLTGYNHCHSQFATYWIPLPTP
jgi:hypothetical protein